MSDSDAQAAAAPLQVNAQYIRDLSFETPGAPGIFADLATMQPEITVQVNLNADQLPDGRHEVSLRLNIEAKVDTKTAFIVDLVYAGIFTLRVPAEHLQPFLLIECPRLLFPFARNIVADVVRDGGFPPIMLQPLDFVTLYRNRLEAMAAQQGQTPGNA